MDDIINNEIDYNQLESENTVYITAEEVSQYFFCKRKPYFRYLYKNPIHRTYLQKLGTKFHEKQVELRKKRVKSRERAEKKAKESKKDPKDGQITAVDYEKVYEQLGTVKIFETGADFLDVRDLDLSKPIKSQYDKDGEQYYDVYLYDPELHIGGIVDYIAYDGSTLWPVDFKTGQKPRNKINDPHKFQLVTLAMLIDSTFNMYVEKAQVHYLMYKETRELRVTVEDRLTVLKALREIRSSILNEDIPPPTKLRNVCKYCECYNVCRGV